MDLRHPQIVAADEAVEDFGEEAPLLAAEPAHDAEIERDDPAFAVDEKIALMHVGVKEAVAQGVAQKRLDERARQPGGSNPRAASRRGSLSGVPSIHSIVSTSRVVRSQSIAGARKSGSSCRFSANSDGGRRLEAEVHLHAHRARERLDHLDRRRRRSSGAHRSAIRAAKNMSARSRRIAARRRAAAP